MQNKKFESIKSEKFQVNNNEMKTIAGGMKVTPTTFSTLGGAEDRDERRN